MSSTNYLQLANFACDLGTDKAELHSNCVLPFHLFFSSQYSSGSSGGDSSCDESRRLRRRTKPVQPLLVTQACESESFNDSEFTTSAAEESCDTVIYVGPKGEALSDQDLTDFEGPPGFDENATFDEERKFDLPSLREFVEPSLDFGSKGSKLKLDKFAPELKEKNCTCNLQKCTASNSCIHGTSMTNVDTDFVSNSSLLSSFSENRRKNLSRNTSESTIKDELSSYVLSENAKEALMHSSSPYYCLVPEYPKSESSNSLNSFSNRREDRKFNSLRNRTSKLSSSQQRFCSTSERGRSRAINLPMSTPANRTSSLDRIFGKNENNAKDNFDVVPRTRSEESIASSQQTVYNFERDLVSKIVERLDVENEISEMEPELISRYLENEQLVTAEEERNSKLIEQKIKRYSIGDSIIVTVTSQERLDPMYIDSLNVGELLRQQREASIAEFQQCCSPMSENKAVEEMDEQFDLLLSKTWEPREDLSKDTSSEKDKNSGQS